MATFVACFACWVCVRLSLSQLSQPVGRCLPAAVHQPQQPRLQCTVGQQASFHMPAYTPNIQHLSTPKANKPPAAASATVMFITHCLQVPHLDARAATLMSIKKRGVPKSLACLALGILDRLATAVGLPPIYLPLVGPVGSLAFMQLNEFETKEYFSKHPSVYQGAWTNQVSGVRWERGFIAGQRSGTQGMFICKDLGLCCVKGLRSRDAAL